MIKRVCFKNDKGQRLRGALHFNPGVSKTKALIVLHGFTESMQGTPKLLAKGLERNFAVFRFDFTGNGSSEGERIVGGTYSQEISDVCSAIACLESFGFKEFALVGYSMGGAVALLSADHPGVKAIVAIAPPCHPEKMPERIVKPAQLKRLKEKGKVLVNWYGKKFIATKEFFDDAAKYNVLETASRISKPLLLLHGAEDRLIPLAHVLELCSSAKACTLVKIEGAGHCFEGKKAQLIEEIRSWLMRNF